MSSCETACNVGCSNAIDLETITRCARMKRHLTLLFVDKGVPPISASTYCGVDGEEKLEKALIEPVAPEHEMVAAAKLFASVESRQPELSGQTIADDTSVYAAGEPVSLNERAENFYA